MKVRSRIDQMRNHANSAQPATSGGLKMHQKLSAIGTGAMNMNGCRRPQRFERQRSEIDPISGSEMASAKIEMVGTSPANSTSSPSTWL